MKQVLTGKQRDSLRRLYARQARPQPAADLKRGGEKLVAGFEAALGESEDSTEEGEIGGGEEEKGEDETGFFQVSLLPMGFSPGRTQMVGYGSAKERIYPSRRCSVYHEKIDHDRDRKGRKKVGCQRDEPVPFAVISHQSSTIPGGLQALYPVEGEPGENGMGKLMLKGREQGPGNLPAKKEQPGYVVEGEADSEQQHRQRIVQRMSKYLEKSEHYARQQSETQQADRPLQKVHDRVDDPSHSPIITGRTRACYAVVGFVSGCL